VIRDPGSGLRDPESGRQRLRPERGDEVNRREAAAPSDSERGWGPASSDKSGHDVRKKKLSYRESRELESLPARIERLEDEQSRLRAEAAAPDFYKESPDHIRAVLARIELIAPELEAALTRWVELEERTKSV
jgi:hypothetical protein